ncbi:MAG: translation initiation factor IF-3 [Alphaproteobacteria bacterium]
MNNKPNKKDTTRVNESIRAEEVRLIDENGENVGVVNTSDALKRAHNVGLDLVEISPNAKPPVAKIIDYGKYRYEQQKKASEAKKKQKVIEIKEVKFRPNTDENDFNIKMRNVRKFLEQGNKVKITLRFRGREMAHQELGMEIMKRVEKGIEGIGKVDSKPNMEGRQATMMLSPDNNSENK